MVRDAIQQYADRQGLEIVFSKGHRDYDMTNYLYDFVTSNGSIAHYNKYGWIGTYPTKEDFKNFFKRNEFGEDIYNYVPHWKSDCKEIANYILKIV